MGCPCCHGGCSETAAACGPWGPTAAQQGGSWGSASPWEPRAHKHPSAQPWIQWDAPSLEIPIGDQRWGICLTLSPQISPSSNQSSCFQSMRNLKQSDRHRIPTLRVSWPVPRYIPQPDLTDGNSPAFGGMSGLTRQEHIRDFPMPLGAAPPSPLIPCSGTILCTKTYSNPKKTQT